MSDAARIDGLFELAFRRHEAGQFREAEQLYRDILEADPRQLDCWHFLGAIALQEGRPEAAVDLIGKALAANDGIAAYHASIAEAYRALREHDQAIDHYRKAVAIDPRFFAAHGQLAELLRQAGDHAGAIEHYGRGIAANSDAAFARHNRGALLLEQGRAEEALDDAIGALLQQDTPHSRALFVQCVSSARTLPGTPDFRHLLTRAMREIWARPVELAGAALAVICGDRAIRDAVSAVDAVWPRRPDPRAIAPAMGSLMQDPLLSCVLESTPVASEEMERLMSCARTLLLDAALRSGADIAPEMLPFACALARQCFINEYLFQLPDVEKEGSIALRSRLVSDLSGTKPIFAIQLIAYACYAPLHSLDRDSEICSRPWTASVQALINQQILETEQEKRYRSGMQRLSAVSDQTSVRVREQYEENPYPRWIVPGPVEPQAGIAAYLQSVCPSSPIRNVPADEQPEILVAGCGTGQQPIDAARRFPGARVLAIDLSLASLGYAQRKAVELGVANIDFTQADIVELELPGRTFDLIEAVGVLHHLAAPLQGWSRLLETLKPGGFMRLGFYSERGRAGVAAAREFVAAGGYDATPDGIRQCRQNLIKTRDPRLHTVFGSPDFYSVSACRDLLFHVEEHPMTLHDIAEFLQQHGLMFLGFEIPHPVVAKYRARFPEDRAATDLAKWELFESDQPDTFAGMYRFWVQA